MSDFPYGRPQLPSHYYILCEPPDAKGEEVLRFVSDTRAVKIKGRSFRDFQLRVVPLLDGTHSFDDIAEAVGDLFERAELQAALTLLADQNLLRDASLAAALSDDGVSREPQLNFLHEVSTQPAEVQRKLAATTVVVLGLGAVGAGASLALAASGIAKWRLVDHLRVSPADPYLSAAYASGDIGAGRAEIVRRRLEQIAPRAVIDVEDAALDTDAEIAATIAGCDFVLCCVDGGQASLAYKLNRVCLASGTPWIACDCSAAEVVVGPLVVPDRTACHLCYKMRLVAGSETPEDEFAYQSFLDRRKQDDSMHRQNLVFAAGLGAQLVALEAFKQLTGVLTPVTRGRIFVFDTMHLTCTPHVVLRKPWCPACSPAAVPPEPMIHDR
jgi:bacteriocin biosynthesis cyclodehydratase domain-containing protein